MRTVHWTSHTPLPTAANIAAALALCAVALLAAGYAAWADQTPYDVATYVDSESDVDETLLADSDELAADYVEAAFYEDVATSEEAATDATDATADSAAAAATADGLDEDADADSAADTSYGVDYYTDEQLLDLYYAMREFIEDVAASGGSSIFTYTFDGGYNPGLTDWSETKEALGLSTMVRILMNDCPFDFYWFDKTAGWSMSYNYTTRSDGTYRINYVTVKFSVSGDYADDEDYTVVTPATKISTAKSNAAAVVSTYASTTNVEDKLTAYKDKICSLTSYNDDAADGDVDYGDPWQLIYVFDGDSSTTVVCEGYSKAFKYLCDLTWSDDGPVQCYLVSGTTTYNGSTGEHMWNIVQVDGDNYLADVTNSDSGCIGSAGDLFLVHNSSSVSGSYTSGYTVTFTKSSTSYSIKYVYTDTMFDYYTSAQLKLATSSFPSDYVAIDLSGATVTLGATSYTYTGTARTPSVTVKLDGTTLTKNTDYTVTYADNVDAGTATVTIEGMGDYFGTIEKTFTISARAISSATATLSSSSYTYTGSECTPTVTLTYTYSSTTTTLVEGEDYTLAYSDNVDAGTATVTVTAAGSNWTGTKTVTFTINARAITSCSLTISPATYVYSGAACEPATILTYNGMTLVEGTDYTREITGDNVNVGTPGITLTGMGNYTGTWSTVFNINQKSIASGTLTLEANSYVYDGTAKEPATTLTLTLNGSTVTLTEGSDYTVEYTDNVEVGTATVTCTGTGNFTGTLTKTFSIAEPDISEGTLTLEGYSFEYAASAIEPVATVTLSGVTLVEGEDYTVEYADNVNAGTATVTATGCGSYTGTLSCTFAIERRDISDATVKIGVLIYASDYVYDGTAKEPVPAVYVDGVALEDGVDYTWEYEGDNVNVGTFYMVCTGIGNYTGTCSKEAAVTYARMSLTDVVLEAESVVYDGSEQQPSATITYNGMTLVEGVDYTAEYSDNVEAGTATVTFTGMGNYTSTTTATFTIEPADLSAAEVALSKTSYTYDGTAKEPDVTVTAGGTTLAEGVDYTLAYADNTDSGTATVTVTGAGNYTGTATASFSIAVRLVELYGQNRYATMEAIVQESFGDTGSDYAVVATGTNFPDALAAASLAGALDAPVVLISPKTAESAVETLEELGVSAAYVVGGASAVSDAEVAAIEAAGIAVERLNGANRYATAIAIADEVLAIGGASASDTCIVAAGGTFPDALSASPYAYWSGSPIYLAKADGSVSSDVVAAIKAAGYERIVVLGGTSAVSEAGYATLAATGAEVERVYGANRYSTSSAMATWSAGEGMSYDGAVIATGTAFPDALAGASLAGSNGSVLLLAAASVEKSTALTDALTDNAGVVNTLYVLGGTSAVSQEVRDAAVDAAS